MNESRKMDGATCDRREEGDSFYGILGYLRHAWIKPTYSEEAWPDETRAEEQNVNYFTCRVSSVDIGGVLFKSYA